MHRIDGDGYITSGGKRLFDAEDVGVRYATQVTHGIMNAVQEEIAAAVEASGQTLLTSAANDAAAGYGSQLKKAIFDRNYINGFDYSISGSTFTPHSVGSPGERCICKNHDNSELCVVTLDLGYTKALSTNWSAGSGGGAKPSSLTFTASRMYYLFAIWKADGSVDFGIDSTANASALLSASSFTYYRVIGWALRNSTNDGFAKQSLRANNFHEYLELPTETLLLNAAGSPGGGELEVCAPYQSIMATHLDVVDPSNSWSLNYGSRSSSSYRYIYGGASVRVFSTADLLVGNLSTTTARGKIYMTGTGAALAITFRVLGYFHDRKPNMGTI